MATERWKRLRACAGGLGMSIRIAASSSSSQRRARLGRATLGGLAARRGPLRSVRARAAGARRRRGREDIRGTMIQAVMSPELPESLRDALEAGRFDVVLQLLRDLRYLQTACNASVDGLLKDLAAVLR